MHAYRSRAERLPAVPSGHPPEGCLSTASMRPAACNTLFRRAGHQDLALHFKVDNQRRHAPHGATGLA